MRTIKAIKSALLGISMARSQMDWEESFGGLRMTDELKAHRAARRKELDVRSAELLAEWSARKAEVKAARARWATVR